ncbi:nuclear transport factor 2 family protein [Lacinutrix sp. MedPE-SW]|uniref:nuclear transport factor 2 family protein n=1 Tax=Lacinutrix sp. MedPE-SW TaxID=1860087 RepID=UPI000912561C|nr:nuclear transport factor 2 family protein [Lacinutrix sp. MedPE-SW]OIQ24012.1 MAG: 3-methyl-2-oxobutanoate hydroxymethyltransferase [Lacinutrix sp. MedPE-SW]
MKYLPVVLAFFLITSSKAQSKTESNSNLEVKQVIERFFEGFHKQDTTILKSVIYKQLQLQTINKDNNGVVQLSTTKYSNFLKSIMSIPEFQEFNEKILNYTIKIDGNMANVWTDYEFWFNGQLSHCGVNSFQLIKTSDGWKIFYIVDTRRQKGCSN